MNPHPPADKRLILIPPDKEFLKRFSFRLPRHRLLISRPLGNKNPSYIVLREWPKLKVLKFLFFLPLLIYGLIVFLIVLLLAGLVGLINKKRGAALGDNILDYFLRVATSEPYITKYDFQEFASEMIKSRDSALKRVLYVHMSQKKLLFRIDAEKAKWFIDDIWVYDEFSELLDRIEEDGYSFDQSFMVDFDILYKNNVWKKSFIPKERRYSSISWLSEINFDDFKRKVSQRRVTEPKLNATVITLKPNDFLGYDVVFYYEPSYNAEVNKHLSSHFDQIDSALKEKGMSFCYAPSIATAKGADIIRELQAYIRYINPEVGSVLEGNGPEWVSDAFLKLEISDYYQNISELLGLSEITEPCFIHSKETMKGISEYRKYTYSVFYLKGRSKEDLSKEIETYINHVRVAKDDIYFSLRRPDPEDPDDMFYHAGQEISAEIEATINKIKANNNEKILIDSLIFMVRSLKDLKPDLCKSLSEVLYNSIKKETGGLSRLKVDEQFRIFLPDYDNIEINLTPLPKTLYFFLLQNPDGVKWKELYHHREELIKIYSRIGNRTDMDTIRKHINELTDARSNSVNEKCSRIKEAFLIHIDDSIARHYYITGSRSENKCISLDRSLVEFSHIK